MCLSRKQEDFLARDLEVQTQPELCLSKNIRKGEQGSLKSTSIGRVPEMQPGRGGGLT